MLVIAMLLLTIIPASAESGVASHYSTRDKDQPGSRVACRGHRLVDGALTVAHRSRPCGSKVVISRGGRRVVATVIDRGPFVRGRIVDVSMAVARALGFRGTARVELH